MNPFERLEAWRAAHELALTIYRVTASWPARERFGLVSQVQRAAVSVATNIAESSAKRGPREFRRFVDIALGAMAEVTCLLSLASDLGLVPKDDLRSVEKQRDAASRLVWGLYRSLSRRC